MNKVFNFLLALLITLLVIMSAAVIYKALQGH